MVGKGFISPLGILMRYWIFLCHFWKKQNWAVFVGFFLQMSKYQPSNVFAYKLLSYPKQCPSKTIAENHEVW